MSEPSKAPHQVYAAIRNVMADMAKAGVGKNQTNTQQNFRYRGVDDVMDALAPSLSKHGLIILPHVLSRDVVERESRQGSKLFHTLLQLEYELVCAGDGSHAKVGPIFGEAMDSGDKATNKAMAVAFKYFAIQTFCIPVSGDDPDAETHEVAETGAGSRDQGGKRGIGAPPPTSSEPSPRNTVTGPPSSQQTASVSGKPDVWRPTGDFGYGKKFYSTPWSVMQTHDLEWFLNAERTPQATREKIVAELTWRDYETSTLEAADEEHRAKLSEPLDERIP